jgi:hypothetical protein
MRERRRDDSTGLDRTAIDAIATTDELLRAIATNGVTTDVAPFAAARAADDPLTVFTASFEFVDLVPRFLTEALDADPGTLITLVAIAIDGLGRNIRDATVGLAAPTHPPDVATSEPDQALAFRRMWAGSRRSASSKTLPTKWLHPRPPSPSPT